MRLAILLCLVMIGFTSLRATAVASAEVGRAERESGAWVVYGGVSGLFDREKNPSLMAEYRFADWRTGVRPWMAVGWATDGAVFAGTGLVYALPGEGPLHCSAGFGPGYYDRHEGRDLGSHLEFLSYVELSYERRGGRSVHLRLAHISNGSLGNRNPGTELLSVGFGFPLR